MAEVEMSLDEKGEGLFFVMEGDQRIGELAVGISGDTLTAYHTEVSPQAEGKGYAKALFSAMVDYARKNILKVVPMCSYVHRRFQASPEEYADVWVTF